MGSLIIDFAMSDFHYLVKYIFGFNAKCKGKQISVKAVVHKKTAQEGFILLLDNSWTAFRLCNCKHYFLKSITLL